MEQVGGCEEYLANERPRPSSSEQGGMVVTCQTGLAKVQFDSSSLEYVGEVPEEAAHSCGELLLKTSSQGVMQWCPSWLSITSQG